MASVRVSAELTMALATAALAELDRRRQARVDRRIDEMMNRRFFRPVSRENALARLKTSEYGLIMMYGWGSDDCIKAIQSACQAALKNPEPDRVVILTGSDLRALESLSSEEKP